MSLAHYCGLLLGMLSTTSAQRSHGGGKPGYGKTQVLVHASKQVADQVGDVSIACPSGCQVTQHRYRLPCDRVTWQTIHVAWSLRDPDAET